jgi:hypothetical protein
VIALQLLRCGRCYVEIIQSLRQSLKCPKLQSPVKSADNNPFTINTQKEAEVVDVANTLNTEGLIHRTLFAILLAPTGVKETTIPSGITRSLLSPPERSVFIMLVQALLMNNQDAFLTACALFLARVPLSSVFLVGTRNMNSY